MKLEESLEMTGGRGGWGGAARRRTGPLSDLGSIKGKQDAKKSRVEIGMLFFGYSERQTCVRMVKHSRNTCGI